jgi:hypothetical protein
MRYDCKNTCLNKNYCSNHSLAEVGAIKETRTKNQEPKKKAKKGRKNTKGFDF